MCIIYTSGGHHHPYIVMHPELITRLVKLIEKTGDRVILPDLETGKAVVVMDLDAYERLAAKNNVGIQVPADTDIAALSAETPSIASAPPAAVTASAPALAPAPPSLEVRAPAPRPFAPQPPEGLPIASEAPVAHRHAPAPAPMPLTPVPETSAPLIHTQNKAKNRGLEDLTQEELLDRINRDIDDWKTAQDARRTDTLRSAVYGLETSDSTKDHLEEEERFFLEPIE